MKALLIANRGEIAIRIARAARELGIRTVAVYAPEDALCPHLAHADETAGLAGRGAAAYLDIDALVDVARTRGCDAVHPGYGFHSENPAFARRVIEAGLDWVGPDPATLARLGDKAAARVLATACGVPVPTGSEGPATLESAAGFLARLDGRPMVVKAVSGGGGRGMRVVRDPGALEEAWRRARSEAELAFGDGALYVEEYLGGVRHVEVQVLGDGADVVHLYERECSLQRRHQKLVEIAPSPSLTDRIRDALTDAAVRIARATGYRSAGTIEFLVDTGTGRHLFIEANARLQVEHTVTEQITGVDIVQAQLRLAEGNTLAELGLTQGRIPRPRGHAIQARINMETMTAEGTAKPSGGRLAAFELPSGPGVRVDTYGRTGYTTSPAFDSLLAKLIVHSTGDYAATVRKMRDALGEMRIEGVATNAAFLQNLFAEPAVVANEVDTAWLDTNVARLVEATVQHRSAPTGDGRSVADDRKRALAGARIDGSDPLAVLDHGKVGSGAALNAPPAALAPVDEVLPDGVVAIRAPMQGTIVAFDVAPGDAVWAGRQVLVMEAMKMEHVITADASGIVQRLGGEPGDTVFEDHPLIYLEAREVASPAAAGSEGVDFDRIRPDLAEAFARKAAGLDENRPEAVAKRRKTGHRTARENIADLCDPGSFVEYGSVVLAAQRRRRTIEDLIKNTTGDGMVCGLGRVNGDLFPPERARTMVMSYDYMVLAGTQGGKNHAKKDRMFELAEQFRLPTVLFAEGGGGRPGDTDGSGVAGLDCWAFTYFARLSGLVPIVGITTGRCFAGNAVLLGCCDVIIATAGSNIGIGGPAMIEGGGLGIFRPEEVGPMDVQVPNGVVDIAVSDEAEAVEVAKRYLSYFQGAVAKWDAPDARALRFVIPENRLRWYDMRKVIEGIADVGTVLELRRHWGIGLITAFIRVEGLPIGVIANDPGHLSGAIDAEGADKGARFMQLCDAFDVPILSLCDCPGIMVGPEIEKTALVRHAARMFVTGANIDVPLMTIVTRKAYGLGAQAMAGGSFKAPLFCVTWPTGEFGGMGLEGAVKLGYRKELQAIEDPAERKSTYEQMVAGMYERGKAVNMASHFELDDVIDPADTRKWIVTALHSVPPPPARQGKKRRNVDTW